MVVPFSNTKLRVPPGFQSLLVGLSTEVLRSQPRNIHAFAAEYFEKLLKRRGKNLHKYLIPIRQKWVEWRIFNEEIEHEIYSSTKIPRWQMIHWTWNRFEFFTWLVDQWISSSETLVFIVSFQWSLIDRIGLSVVVKRKTIDLMNR